MIKIFQNTIKQLKNQTMPTVAEYIRSISGKPIYIYGAGCFGKELYQVFGKYQVQIAGFIDQAAEARKTDVAASVYYPEQIEDKAGCLIVVGIVLNKRERLALWSVLAAFGFRHIVDGQSIRAHYVYANEGYAKTDWTGYFSKATEDIEYVYDLWADDESRQTYEKNLTAHIKRDYQNCMQTDEIRQYFVQAIPFNKGFSRFLDCGAYIGDTLKELCEVAGEVEAVAAFEPNLQNFSRLSKCYEEELSGKIKEGVLFPCGIAGKTKLQNFTLAGGSSAIGQNGDEVVQCIALDDVLKNFAPTFIKMDIEGAEYEALEGAQKMIRKYRPDLAISVYHIIDHFYQIPLLIQNWNLGYRFYLRTHSSCCMESILYAVCPERGDG